MTDGEIIEEEFVDQPEAAVEGQLAVSALGPLAQRQESIAQILTEDANLEKLTHLFSRQEPRLYVKAHGELALMEAVGREDEVGFEFPDIELSLLRNDYRLRNSVKQQTRLLLRDITKIFERGGESTRRGLFGRR